MGINLRQPVSEAVYNGFIDGVRDTFLVQKTEYFTRKLNGKKYFWLVNDELPEKPAIRFEIVSIQTEDGIIQEDIYGQTIRGKYLKIALKKREKTR
jgi:hypothetical protein